MPFHPNSAYVHKTKIIAITQIIAVGCEHIEQSLPAILHKTDYRSLHSCIDKFTIVSTAGGAKIDLS